MTETMRFFFCGVGGLGTLTTAGLVARAALESGLEIVASEVHGMSQRGGSVQTCVLIGGARSPLIADGDADVFIGLEPLEALRHRAKIGAKTTVLLNRERVVPVTVTMGGPPYPEVALIEASLGSVAREIFALNATSLATELGEGRAGNVAMLGAMYRLRAMPFEEDALYAVLQRSLPARYLEVNWRAFQAGKRAAGEARS
ncbi:MAG: indolepyruvate oxidoreductase subunit beta [Bradymonadaceae bacterium]